MKLTPIKSYRDPGYPTTEILSRHPELLRVLPRRWRNNPLVLGALAGILALLEQSPAQADDKPTLRVAPIFVHGTGQAAFGGMGGSPRALLTEIEAREIIEQESKKAGVEFLERAHKLADVPLPITDEFAFLDREDAIREKKPEKSKNTSRPGTLELSGWNAKLQVGYKFVAREDFKAWETKEMGRMCTVSEFDMLDAAKRLHAGLTTSKERGTVVLFYDPVASVHEKQNPDHSTDQPENGKVLSKEEKETREEIARKPVSWEERNAVAKKATAEELRAQVRDFLAWLKAQGVI